MQSWIFSIISPVFSLTWSFRNHYDMLVSCSRNIYYIISVETSWAAPYFCGNFIYTKFIYTEHLCIFETEMFCNIINVLTINFYQFHASLKKSYSAQTFERLCILHDLCLYNSNTYTEGQFLPTHSRPCHPAQCPTTVWSPHCKAKDCGLF